MHPGEMCLDVIKCLMTKFYAECELQSVKSRSIYDYPEEKSAKIFKRIN